MSGWLLNQLDSPDFAWRTKNSLLGIVEYTGKAIVCQGNFSTRSWVCLGAFSAGIRGVFGVEVEGRFSMIWRGSSGVFEAHPGTPVPSTPYSPFFFITTEGKHPRGSRGGVSGWS